MSGRVAAIVAVAGLILATGDPAALGSHRGLDVPARSTDPVARIAAAGDIACGFIEHRRDPGPRKCRERGTARLLDRIDPHAVLALGDLQYERGSLRAFRRFYDRSWGRKRSITFPTPGNHEYGTPGARGYFDYWNGKGDRWGRAGRRRRGYHSFDIRFDLGGPAPAVPAWHGVSLNSQLCVRDASEQCSDRCLSGAGRCGTQARWLINDLNDHPARSCLLAYWHHPRFSSDAHGRGLDTPQVQPLINILESAGVDVILAGHSHFYERFRRTAGGYRPFTIGTGGRSLIGFGPIESGSVFRLRSFGVLRLALRPYAYSWAFWTLSGERKDRRATPIPCNTPLEVTPQY